MNENDKSIFGMTHYLRHDTRIEALKSIITPFQNQLEKLRIECKKNNFNYWDSFFADDFEHIAGIVFIALQNYINSSISDLYSELTKLHTKYLDDKKICNSQTTRIELIISIANYYKHRDHPSELHKNTAKYLDDLKIKYKHYYGNEKDEYFHEIGSTSPVFSGFSILSKSWNFNDLITIVSEWRENMWLKEEDINKKHLPIE